MENDLTVHVIDDEEAFRKSLAFLLVSSGFAVRAYESASAFLSSAPLPENGCIVTDLRMPNIDGIGLIERLRALKIDLPTIVLTGYGDVKMTVRAMKAGATDFIEKPFKDEALIQAIRDATSRQPSVSLNVHPDAVAARLGHLTEREHQVLAGVMEGLQNKVIAFNLGISARTVEVHRANLMAKMEARNLAELLRMMMSHEGLPKHRINT